MPILLYGTQILVAVGQSGRHASEVRSGSGCNSRPAPSGPCNGTTVGPHRVLVRGMLASTPCGHLGRFPHFRHRHRPLRARIPYRPRFAVEPPNAPPSRRPSTSQGGQPTRPSKSHLIPSLVLHLPRMRRPRSQPATVPLRAPPSLRPAQASGYNSQ